MNIIQIWLLLLGTPIYAALDTLKCAFEKHFWYTMMLVAFTSSILTLFLQCAIKRCWKLLVMKFKKDDTENQNVFELKQMDPESLRLRNKKG